MFTACFCMFLACFCICYAYLLHIICILLYISCIFDLLKVHILHICCIFAVYFLHIHRIFLAYDCIFDLPKVHILHFLCIFLHIYSVLLLMSSVRFLRPSPRPTPFSLACQWQPGDPPAPLDPSRSNHAASNLGTTTPPAPLKVSSVNTEQWNVVVVAEIQHMQTKSSETRSCKKLFQSNMDREQIGRSHY